MNNRNRPGRGTPVFITLIAIVMIAMFVYMILMITDVVPSGHTMFSMIPIFILAVWLVAFMSIIFRIARNVKKARNVPTIQSITSVATGNKLCPSCHKINASDATFCNRCGKRLIKECEYCDTVNAYEAEYCAKCGAKLD